jgi:hypothetical protein
MRRTVAEIILVSILFATCLAVQVLFYPSTQSVLIAVLDAAPVALAAVWWGMVPGLVAGLGLVRVLGIIRQRGGGSGVESAPGRGTTMTIYLPMAPLT